MDHFLDCGCIWEVKHDCHCGERRRGRSNDLPTVYTGKTIEILHISMIKCRLTSVGHEDFHSSVLQQVSSGKDGTDLREQPFSMETFCISKNLGEQTEKQKVGYIWFKKGQEERGHRRTQFRTGKGGGGQTRRWVGPFFTH